MGAMKRFALTVSVAVAVTTIVGSANAQLWLRDRNAESKGFHTGGVEIHRASARRSAYDSNYFNRSGKERTCRSSTPFACASRRASRSP